MPELIEFTPRIFMTVDSLGSPDTASTESPGTCPCSAWSNAAVGVFSIFSALIVDTEPATVPFLRTPYAITTTSSSACASLSSATS